MKSTEKSSKPIFAILLALSMAHCLNDTMQSVISAVYPLLKENLALNFADIGLVTLTYQMSASIFQPVCGYIFDKRPNAWFLPIGMTFTMTGLLLISIAHSLNMLLFAVLFSGIGSSILHPEASRLTSMAAGKQRGLAQSIFQVGGTTGFALGPLLAALFISPYGQQNVALFSICAFIAIVGLIPVCKWYAKKLKAESERRNATACAQTNNTSGKALPKSLVLMIVSILIFLVFTKNAYTISIANYYTFYAMDKFGATVETSQLMLFVFLFSSALGTLLGGPIGDRIGRRLVIWWSIWGAAPFALALPYANQTWTIILSAIIGFIMSSAFSAIIVYAQELFPKKVGMISGLFFGLAFGTGGIVSAALGVVADKHGIDFVYQVMAFMPVLGFVAYFLPRVRTLQAMKNSE